nr:viperin family antiviral radical SAM protein [uncultured Undibacterium sp.]
MTLLHMGEADARPHLSELVINWHITEVCNYRCSYCYAKWNDNSKELLHDWERTQRLLDEVFSFFSPDNSSNPLRSKITWGKLRLNLAGGEPLLYRDKLLRILSYSKLKGVDTSIITNGSRLDVEYLDQLAPHVSMLGLSIDSSNKERNIEIGRTDKIGNQLGLDSIADLFDRARKVNPGIRLKINTVINAINYNEDMHELIRSLAPQRWKVFRMLPVITNDLSISNADFQKFVEKHQSLSQVMSVEGNEEMSESYIMIDPHGRFFQNRIGHQGYQYSRPIESDGAARAFDELRLSAETYASRYRMIPIKETI